MSKVAIDIDGVVCDIVPRMMARLRKQGYEVVTPNKYEFDIKGCEDPDKLRKETFFNVIRDESAFIRPYLDAPDAVLRIGIRVGDITFLTARDVALRSETETWLRHHFSIPHSVVSKKSADKVPYLIQNKFDFFIEDRLSTANQAAEAGIETFLVNQLWNINYPIHPEITRVSDVMGAYAIMVIRKAMREVKI